jgi:hypothetical protein
MNTPDEVHQWRKSKRSSSGNCVEVCTAAQAILLRDSKDPEGAVLSFSHEAFEDFLRGVRGRQFDLS